MIVYVTVKQAAKIYKKSEKTIYRWIEFGNLIAKKDRGGFCWLIQIEAKEIKENIRPSLDIPSHLS